ncbi:MAG: trypsin [Chloroflexi bacterium]|nr:trypsin [Chloroflexota bacterium]|tara:strand:+ start:90 stop:1196 length:1107 start_codon:yes stop_codon:yes gene_type:complete
MNKYKFLKTIFLISLITILITSCSENVETFNSKPKNNSIEKNLILSYENILNNLYNENVSSLVKISILYPGITEPVTGSGFIWDNQGHIITNDHVVRDIMKRGQAKYAQNIQVLFENNIDIPAEIVAGDPYSDVAVIKLKNIKNIKLNPVLLGDSTNVKVGQTAIALGNPFGQDFTMTIGNISAIGRARSDLISNYQIGSVIQTDAPINPGNSGGPLYNISGEVIGMNSQIQSSSGSSSGIGFAVPSNTIKKVVISLLENGFYKHPHLGIMGKSLEQRDREILEIENNLTGVLITNMIVGGPADKSGLKPGDIIRKIESTSINSMTELINYLADNTKPQETAKLEIIRDKKVTSIDIILGARPPFSQN